MTSLNAPVVLFNKAGTKLELPGQLQSLASHLLFRCDWQQEILCQDSPKISHVLNEATHMKQNKINVMLVGFVHRDDLFKGDPKHKPSGAKVHKASTMFPVVIELAKLDVRPLRVLFTRADSPILISQRPFSGHGVYWISNGPPTFTRRHQLMKLAEAVDKTDDKVHEFTLITSVHQLPPVITVDIDEKPEEATDEELDDLSILRERYQKWLATGVDCCQLLQRLPHIETPTPDLAQVFTTLAYCRDYNVAAEIFEAALRAIEVGATARKIRTYLNIVANQYVEKVAESKAIIKICRLSPDAETF